MDTLPTEVLVFVFSYLSAGDVLSCIKVCALLHSLSISFLLISVNFSVFKT